ncbi:hypothetical protein GALMADRAFT_919087 [Galerina marginata CBS 339.88]|uniref:Uncharacterized protein n=1 Tax=Galerina marginata (strain CBS 339.88) TaxID=685588 RepID=A0A067SEM1_GALM3|nr:hypothetical protein GALMADRAFT_919087 [Galerina marginata CBS 339.88]
MGLRCLPKVVEVYFHPFYPCRNEGINYDRMRVAYHPLSTNTRNSRVSGRQIYLDYDGPKIIMTTRRPPTC